MDVHGVFSTPGPEVIGKPGSDWLWPPWWFSELMPFAWDMRWSVLQVGREIKNIEKHSQVLLWSTWGKNLVRWWILSDFKWFINKPFCWDIDIDCQVDGTCIYPWLCNEFRWFSSKDVDEFHQGCEYRSLFDFLEPKMAVVQRLDTFWDVL